MDKKWLNFIITNFITLLRVVGIFALIPVYKKYGGFTTFLLSLAINLNASTFFGSLFDALSDKAFLVINLLLLMSISPYAIILIIFELTIALIQSIKYNVGMNIKSNIFGKIKMWVAGLIISLWYLLTDYKVIHHFNINNLNNKTFLIIFIPLFIIEVITIISYIIEYFSDKNKLDKKIIAKRKKEEEKLYKEIKNVSFWDLMFEHDYYEKYKDYGNLKLLRSLTKKKA